MKLTPDSIMARVFSSRIFGGCNPKEVSAFLERISNELEELIQENAQLKVQVQEKERQLQEYKNREDLLREAITTTQKTTAKIESEAKNSAHQIVQDAHHKAEIIVQDARDSLKAVYQDLSDLRRVHMQMKNTLKAVLQSHQDLLEQDPVHTLLSHNEAFEEDEIEDRVSQKLSQISETKDLL